MSEPKRPELIAAAKELNTLLDPDPKIKTVGVKTDELTKAIVVAAGLLDKGDSLTTETHAVLCALEVELPEGLVIAAAEAGDENGDDAPEEKKPEPVIEREDLVSLIEEMNKVMDLDPAIEASEKSSIDGLKKLIHDNCYDKGECQVFDTDKFSAEAWEVLTALGVQAVVTKKAKDKPAKAGKSKDKPAKAGKSKDKPAKAEKAKKDGSNLKGPGVIKTIATTIKEQGPITKEAILAVLVEKFPDRDAEAMKKTINVQVPNRINKEQDFQIENSDKGWKVAGKAKK